MYGGRIGYRRGMRSTSRYRSRAVWACLVALAALGAGGAQPDLYGPEAPAGVAWVRVVNAGAAGGVAVRVGNAATEVLALGDATRYVRVDADSVEVDVGGEFVHVDLAPEAFVTVAHTPAGVVVVDDPALRDVSRGLLGLLNLTGRAALDLRVPDGTAVVEGVGPGAHAALAVAQATTALLVTADDEVVARIEERTFDRGVAHTVVVTETDAGPAAFVLRATSE